MADERLFEMQRELLKTILKYDKHEKFLIDKFKEIKRNTREKHLIKSYLEGLFFMKFTLIIIDLGYTTKTKKGSAYRSLRRLKGKGLVSYDLEQDGSHERITNLRVTKKGLDKLKDYS